MQTNYGSKLRAHEKVQLTVNLFHHDINLVINHFEEIIQTIQNYVSEKGNAKYKLYGYHQSRIFSVLEKLLISLIKNGQDEKACQAIGTYFGIRPDELISQPVLFIIPNTADGPMYSFPDKVLFVDGNPLEKLPCCVISVPVPCSVNL